MILTLWCFLNLIAPSLSQGPIMQVQAVKRSEAVLPCDTKPPVPNDTVVLVVWYKHDVNAIYSIDSRVSRSLESGIKWSDTAVLQDRANFRTATEPPQLAISNVDERDEALYRCRVDFKTSPTKNFKLNLTVIVPPQRPQIFDESGRELTSFAGPYEEGSEMKLTCVVSGGRPEPWVRWWRDETLVDSTDTSVAYPPDMKNNQLVVNRLSREHLNSVYTCQSSNTNLTLPVSTSLTIDIHFKPMNVSIITEVQPMSANRPYKIVCVSIGSRPPAKITWWRDSEILNSASEEVSDDKNVTTSTLIFTPKNEDNGGRLLCRADNPSLNGAAQEVIWKLDVHYMPHVRLDLGSQMNPEDIEEGDDVYFECKVKANPGAYKVVWKHNNKTIQHGLKGVLVSHKALVLQSVRRTQAGNYTCVASNVEGDGYSNIVQLKVMYKPLCRNEQKQFFGVARNEDASVLCEVDAFPPPDEFMWSFNNSAETSEIPSSKYQNSLSVSLSTLSYTPQTEMDYGTVMCWAKNTVGQQREPCVFHIIAAGRPDSPYNCTLINQTLNSLDVECIEGFDGGQTQSFQLEVYMLETSYLVYNKTSPNNKPSFKVEGLASGANVKIIVYAYNSKGRSDPVALEGYTLKIAEKQTGSPVPFYVTPIVVVLIVGTVMLITCVIVIFGVLKARNRTHVTSEGNMNRLNEKTKVPLRIDAREIYDMDDNNPDLIPCNKDSDYQLVTNAGVHPGSVKLTQERSPSQSQTFQENLKDPSLLNVDIYENYKNVQQHQSKDKGDELFFEQPCIRRLNGGENMPSLMKRDMTSSLFSENELNRCNLSPSGIPSHREVITVRTPLMANQQESCV